MFRNRHPSRSHEGWAKRRIATVQCFVNPMRPTETPRFHRNRLISPLSRANSAVSIGIRPPKANQRQIRRKADSLLGNNNRTISTNHPIRVIPIIANHIGGGRKSFWRGTAAHRLGNQNNPVQNETKSGETKPLERPETFRIPLAISPLTCINFSASNVIRPTESLLIL